MEAFWRDVRYAARLLRRAPGFAVTAILTIALGIGANTGIFSLINGFMRPLPVPHADRLVVLAADVPGDETGFRYRFSYPALADYRAEATVFSDVVGYDTRIGGLTVDGRTEQFLYQAVSGNFFEGLGLIPAAGRLLQPGEGEALGAEPVVVLGYACWMKRFGGRADAVGRIVRVEGEAVRVIGVAPEDFHGSYEGVEMDGYVPLRSLRGQVRDPQLLFQDRSFWYLTLIGRLKPGVSMTQAQTAVDAVARRLEGRYPATDNDVKVRLVPEPLSRPIPLRFFSSVLPAIRVLLLALAASVLLLACVNVTNLLFVRATVRAREMAIRSALGSDRRQLARLLLAESFLIAAAGTGLGLLFGSWAGSAVIGSVHMGIDLPLVIDTHIDWRVFTYALAIAAGTGVVIGILPAWRASQTRVTDVLHDGDRGGSSGAARHRLRGALVVIQVAGSFVLLVVAGLFVRTLQQSEHMDLGFDPDQLLTLRLDPHQLGYDLARSQTFYKELERRLGAIPGVERTAYSFSLPMGYIIGGCPVEPEGAEVTSDEKSRPAMSFNSVGAGYFETMKLGIVKGRAFDDHDTADSPRVAIVNETMAARIWPGQNALGKHLKVLCTNLNQDRPWEVVGVAHDSKYVAVFEHPLPHVYIPIVQTEATLHMVVVRSATPPPELAARIRREIAAIDPDMPVADVRTMHEALSGGMGYLMFRVGATQAAAMGLLGLVLAVVGVYGVTSYGASQRVREVGIRLALGAQPGGVQWLLVRHGARLVAAGLVLGLAASVAATSLLGRVLVVVSAADPATFLGVTAALGGISLVACYVPARRAVKTDPAVALRHE